jgi:hypothetical protein
MILCLNGREEMSEGSLTVGNVYKLKNISTRTSGNYTLRSISYVFSPYPHDNTRKDLIIPIDKIDIGDVIHWCDTKKRYECLMDIGRQYSITKNDHDSLGNYKWMNISYVFSPYPHDNARDDLIIPIEFIDNTNSPMYEFTKLDITSNHNLIPIVNDSYTAVKIPREIISGGRRKTRKAIKSKNGKKAIKARKVKKTRKHRSFNFRKEE